MLQAQIRNLLPKKATAVQQKLPPEVVENLKNSNENFSVKDDKTSYDNNDSNNKLLIQEQPIKPLYTTAIKADKRADKKV